LDPLYWLAAHAILFFHRGFAPIFGSDSFFAWALSVVLLVIVVRILIFPLFVKQVKSQRKLQMMQPLMRDIREKWGHDKQRMNQEMLNLQREHGNPLLGCLPILLQIPLFVSLFHVFNSLKPVDRPGGLTWVSRVDLPAETVRQIAEAKLLGISLSTAFTSKAGFLSFIGANGTNVKIAAVVLIVLMGTTTFVTQKQIMARTGGSVDSQQAMIQKFMLYGSPIMLAVFGFQFPIAVLLYWLTTNLWSMGQQFFVIKKMPPLQAAGAGGGKAKVPGARPAPGDAVAISRPKPGVKPQGSKRTSGSGTAAGSSPGSGTSGNAAATSSRRGSGAAPPGTRSPRSAAATGDTAKGDTTKGGAAKGGANGTVPPDAAVQPGSVGAAASNDVGGAAQPASRNGSSPNEPPQRPTKPPVGAGARRQTGGSRPAKRRGKNKRPGGRR
jgi:YidC/Oxa1 family membrane protein insertase